MSWLAGSKGGCDMFSIPRLPSWDAIHPILVHFPVALLLTAPVFLMLAMVWKRQTQVMMVSALVVMALGLGGVLLALSSGEAAEEQAEQTAAAHQVLERHEDLAETTRTYFIVMTAVLGATLVGFSIGKKPVGHGVRAGVLGAYLIAYAPGLVVLANTAHEGGRLVHEFGVHAPLASAGQPANDAGRPLRRHDDDDDD